MRPDSSSRTAVTCFLLRSVLSDSDATIALFVYFSLIAGGLFAAMDLSFSCFIAVLGLVDDGTLTNKVFFFSAFKAALHSISP